MREGIPDVRIVAVEPAECAILSGGGRGQHRIEGIGDGFVPDVLRTDLIDEVVAVSDQDAIDMARRLAREEGIFGGISSGANVWAALEVARRLGEGGLLSRSSQTPVRGTSAQTFSDNGE